MKLAMLMIMAMPVLFFASCNDDDDDNNNGNKTDTPQLKEIYDKKGDVLFYSYDKKDRISQVQLYDDGLYLNVNLGYNPLKMTRFRTTESDEEFNEESLFDTGELGRVSNIKTDKNGNITKCKVTLNFGVVNATITYDSEQHPVKVVHEFTGTDYSSTDIAELTWENGNMTHYTVTDEDGLYLESIVEYGNAVNITGQPTYAMALAYWNDVEYFTGVLGKLSKNLPTKLTTNYYVDEILEETTVYNISYSYNDNDDVAEEYFDNDEKDFWINHIGQWVNHYEVYYGYRK